MRTMSKDKLLEKKNRGWNGTACASTSSFPSSRRLCRWLSAGCQQNLCSLVLVSAGTGAPWGAPLSWLLRIRCTWSVKQPLESVGSRTRTTTHYNTTQHITTQRNTQRNTNTPHTHTLQHTTQHAADRPVRLNDRCQWQPPETRFLFLLHDADAFGHVRRNTRD